MYIYTTTIEQQNLNGIIYYMNSKHHKKHYILVTGGLGYIGSHMCTELLNNNYDVIIVDNLSNSSILVLDKIKQLSVSAPLFYKMDLLDKSQLDVIFQKHNITHVIHFAGLKSVGDSISNPLLYYDNNLQSTTNLLSIMSKYNCKNFIFSSSATVYGNNVSPVHENMKTGNGITNPYGKTKYMIEEMLKDLMGWKIIMLRYFNPIGNHKSGLLGEKLDGTPTNLMPIILKVVKGELECLNIYGNDYETRDGTCIRDYIHVTDLVKGHLQALYRLELVDNYEIYNLGTGDGTTVLELIETFERVNNIKINYKFIDRRKGDVAVVYADVSKARDRLKWDCTKTLEDMCQDNWVRYESGKL
jgi:UDP-glucose 4-epimerase